MLSTINKQAFRTFVFALSFALTLVAPSLMTLGDALANSADRYVLGTVHSPKGEPVNDVIVSVGTTQTRSLSDGSFKLGPLASGTHTVTFTDPANRYLRLDNPRMAPKVTLTDGQTAQEVDVTLKRNPRAVGTISGDVLGAGSQQVAATYVDAFLIDGDDAYNVSTAMVINGAYEMQGLPEGQYVVRVSRYDFTTGTYDRYYYREDKEQDLTTMVKLQAAESVRDIDVQLDTIPHAMLAGSVADPQGRPLAAIEVVLLGLDMQERQTVVTDEQGRFEIEGITPDRYKVLYRDPADRYEESFYQGLTFVTAPAISLHEGDTETLAARLQRRAGGGGTGTVTGSIDLNASASDRVVFFVDVYRALPSGGYGKIESHYVANPGHFKVENVPSGDVRLALRANNMSTGGRQVIYHQGMESLQQAPDVTVARGQETDGVHFQVSL